MAKGKRYSQQLKEDAVKYRTDLPEMTLESTATYLGINVSALKHWLQIAKENNGMVVSRGSGNYSSDEEKGNCEVKTSAARCGRCS